MQIDKDAHKLSHSNRRMGVVELNSDLTGKRLYGAMLGEVTADEVLQGGRSEEILLAQAQLLACGGCIAGIKNLGYRPGAHPVHQCANMVAAVEHVELKRVRRARRPKPERIDMGPAPAGDWRVIGHGLDRFGRMPDVPLRAVFLVPGLDPPSKTDVIFEFGPRELPRVPERQPVFGIFEMNPSLMR